MDNYQLFISKPLIFPSKSSTFLSKSAVFYASKTRIYPRKSQNRRQGKSRCRPAQVCKGQGTWFYFLFFSSKKKKSSQNIKKKNLKKKKKKAKTDVSRSIVPQIRSFFRPNGSIFTNKPTHSASGAISCGLWRPSRSQCAGNAANFASFSSPSTTGTCEKKKKKLLCWRKKK
jgi:hypothetical protein